MSLPSFLDRFMRRQALGAARPVRIDNRHIYILPSRQGWGYGLLLVLLLIGSINYDNNPGLLFTFLLAAAGLNALFLTWRNLLGLEVGLLPAAPVFAGQPATLRLRLDGGGRPGIQVQLADQALLLDLGLAPATVALELPTRRRGWLRPGTLILASRHPLGLFQAWSLLELEEPLLVYPRPAGAASRARPQGGGDGSERPGDEEWHGLRDFRPGDPLSHLDWKSLARERGLMTKQFHDPAGEQPHLIDWDQYAPAATERRLQLLTREVLEAAAGGHPWTLRLPGTRLGPDRGRRHRERCLKALALYGLPESPR